MYYYLLSIMYCKFLATKFKLKTKPKKDEKQKHKQPCSLLPYTILKKIMVT